MNNTKQASVTDDFVFPELKKLENLNDEFLTERVISDNASRIDKFLRKHVGPSACITHPITMHIARHTVGNIAGNNNIPLIMLQKIFRHSKITTTMAYMSNFIHKDADDALDAILAGGNPSKKLSKDVETEIA